MDISSIVATFGEFGIAGIAIGAIVWAVAYFGSSVKKLIDDYPNRRQKHDQLLENNTAALQLCRAALDNNTAALNANIKERGKTEAIIREHDATTRLQFEHIKSNLERLERR